MSLAASLEACLALLHFSDFSGRDDLEKVMTAAEIMSSCVDSLSVEEALCNIPRYKDQLEVSRLLDESARLDEVVKAFDGAITISREELRACVGLLTHSHRQVVLFPVADSTPKYLLFDPSPCTSESVQRCIVSMSVWMSPAPTNMIPELLRTEPAPCISSPPFH